MHPISCVANEYTPRYLAVPEIEKRKHDVDWTFMWASRSYIFHVEIMIGLGEEPAVAILHKIYMDGFALFIDIVFYDQPYMVTQMNIRKRPIQLRVF